MNEMDNKTNPCKDKTVTLGDIIHGCKITIPIKYEEGRGVMGLSHRPIDSDTIMTTRLFCCLFTELEDGKYESTVRMAFDYDSAQMIKGFIMKLPEQIFTP